MYHINIHEGITVNYRYYLLSGIYEFIFPTSIPLPNKLETCLEDMCSSILNRR
jgi:hypothetical protein